ncbi:hypothetical protein [Xanthomonas euvesicatoria]|uniref:hypothetical protein n=1 Tax=Xanthomonas euvesicatoria TaxID=456327 RepID=UPI001C43D0E1|nr:hypothetical protein [Xanthomonas euvesicatoria]MBV6867268.1 hypothetical protein [Xanthomonas campestris pv. coriandri]MCE4330217.1 hypothetical protein [Xanthomonas campestris pv. coriandri]
MAIYMIGYDLNRQGQNYSGLIAKIKEISDGYWHHLDSTWLIGHPGSASVIRDALKPFLDSNDELLVVKLAQGDAAWIGFNTDGSTWLNNSLR